MALAIPERNRYGALGSLLTNNVFIELGDYLARREFVEREILFFSGSG